MRLHESVQTRPTPEQFQPIIDAWENQDEAEAERLSRDLGQLIAVERLTGPNPPPDTWSAPEPGD